MSANIKPLGDRVLVEAVEEKEVVKGGIIIPDSAKEKPLETRIVAIGSGVNDKGEKIELDAKVGDMVLTARYGGTEVKIDDKEYKIMKFSDVLAVLG